MSTAKATSATGGATTGASIGSMIGPWGTAAGAILGGLGGLAGGLGGLFGGNSSSAGLSAKQALLLAQYQAQQEEKRMKNAHQWEVQDLIKAGLNPALSAGGSSAGAIAGNSGQSGNIAANLMSAAQTGRDNAANRRINSAMQAADIFNKIRSIENSAGLQEAQINNTDADTQTKLLNNAIIRKYGGPKAKAELANTILEGEAIRAKTAADRAKTEKTKQDIQIDKPTEVQNSAYGKFLKENPRIAAFINATDNVLDRGSKVIGFVSNFMGSKAALSAAQNFKNVKNVKTYQRTNYYNKKGELSGTRETQTIKQ